MALNFRYNRKLICMLTFLEKWRFAGVFILGIIIMISTGGSNSNSHEKPKTDSATTKTTYKIKGKAGLGNYAKNDKKIVRDKNGIYDKVEVEPEFPGGQNALAGYIQDNISYPDRALSENVSGTVRVSFVVDEHGKIIQPQIISGQNEKKDLEDEAIRVVSRMPAWKPGKVKGRNVKTRLELPITFQTEA
jgi:periplasmic protein TonB